jgi:CheY-like chemotaxis protein
MPHKLLLADDSVTIQRVIELTFADEDIQVIAVGDGKQAIERIQADRPDIVLADVGMPERDGYDVAAFVKSHPDFSRVPVLLLTGAFEPVDEARARAAGCDGVLVKPFEPQMVINRVKDLLAGRQPSGLWPAAPSAQPSRQMPAVDFDLKSVAPAPGSSDLVDDYFDRLDAAFADLDSSAAANQRAALPPTPSPQLSPPLPTRTDDVLADWDPDLAGDPSRPARTPVAPPPPRPEPIAAPPPPTPIAAAPPPPPVAPAPVAPPPTMTPSVVTAPQTVAPAVTMPQGPSLAEAFAALLAAEQGQSIQPASIRADTIPQDAIDGIVERVLDRLSQTDVRSTVLDVAERLVREEIDRIKRA